MGGLEESARRQRRLGRVQRAALSAVGLAGLLAVGVVAGNLVQLLDHVPNKYRLKNQAKGVLSRLAAEGYIVLETKGGKAYARITESGRRALLLRGEWLAQRATKKRWDRRWRVIIFDIPERRRKVRDDLRTMMRRFGFYRLQDSVWVYPHDCEDVISLAKAELKTGFSVLYLIVEKMEGDRYLKQHYGIA